MRVKLKTRMSGPNGSYDPGAIVDLPNGADLIWGGFAEAIESIEPAPVAHVVVSPIVEPETPIRKIKNKKPR